MPAIAVSIVNYRTARLVVAALPALLEDLAGFEHALVVVVDNASGDGDADMIERAIAANGWSRVRLVRSPVNGGFAAGNNLAAAEIARWEHRPLGILLHNPDARVRPGAVPALAATLVAEPSAGAVGARLERPGGEIWSGAFHFPSALGEFAGASGIGLLARRFPSTHPLRATRHRADWVTGAAVLIRTEAWEQVGPMDEGFFLYYEEVDYMRRLRAAGWEVWHCPDATLLHDAGQATKVQHKSVQSGRMPAYWFASWLRYFAKAHGPAYARAAAAARLSGLLLSYPVAALRGRRRALPARYLTDFARFCLFAPLPRVDRDA